MPATGGNASGAGGAAAPEIRDYTALVDVDTFLEVFADADERAREIGEATAYIVNLYNDDNLKEGRELADWLSYSEAFELAEHTFQTPPAPVFGKERRGRGGEGKTEKSKLFGVLSTFDATQRRKRDNARTPLKESEVDFQIKLASTSFNSSASADDAAPLADGLRYDKWGFTYPARAFARLLRSAVFKAFYADVARAFFADDDEDLDGGKEAKRLRTLNISSQEQSLGGDAASTVGEGEEDGEEGAARNPQQ